MLASSHVIQPALSAPASTLCVALIGKGGSGKSAVAANLAVTARLDGLQVGIIDTDPQRSLSDWRNLRGTDDIPVGWCASTAIGAEVAAAQRSGLDLVFIDTAPELGPGLKAAVDVADAVLIITRPASFDLVVTHQRIQLVRERGRNFGVLINAAPPRREGRESPFVLASRDTLRAIGGRLWTGQITARHAVPHALSIGRGVAETDPGGPSVEEYRALLLSIRSQLTTREQNYAKNARL
jgi:chromosome partitioning protein